MTSLFAYLLKNYERKVYIILIFKNSKLLHYLYHQRKSFVWALFLCRYLVSERAQEGSQVCNAMNVTVCERGL